MITSPGCASAITESVTSTKFGMYSPLFIIEVIRRELTPSIGFSLAAYTSRTIARSAFSNSAAKAGAKALVLE